jgi:hypothetical protein
MYCVDLSDGSLQWMESFGSNFEDRAKDVAIAGDTAVIAGYFSGPFSLNVAGSPEPQLWGGTATRRKSSLVVGIDLRTQPGAVKWTLKFGSIGGDTATGVSVHNSVAVVVGFYKKTLSVDIQGVAPSPTAIPKLVSPMNNVVYRIDSPETRGVIQWVGTNGVPGRPAGVAVDSSRVIVVTQLKNVFKYENSRVNGVATVISSSTQTIANANTDILVYCLDLASGELQWARTLGDASGLSLSLSLSL